MEAKLGVRACDKCGEPMRRDDLVVLVAEGWIRGPQRNDLITFWGRDVRYACHSDCWNVVEDVLG